MLDARARVEPVIRATPTEGSSTLSRLAGRPVLLKPEQLQRTGSYKIRGAYNRISRLDPATTPEVVAGSAGNHGQAVALAAALCGIPAVVFMPVNAALPKVEATIAYGAQVHRFGTTVDDAVVAALTHAAEVGATFVPPFDDPLVVAGQGTVGLELAEEAAEAEVVVVPVGGGGLIAGVAVALRALRPDVRIVGVEAEGAASMMASLRAGRPTSLQHVRTMADGIALKSPSALTLAHVEALVDDVVAVSDEEISKAVLLLIERSKAVVEPSGAAGLAAVLAGRVGGSGPAAVVLTGGNVDPLLLVKLVDHGLSSAGRYLVLRLVIADRPGALADLTSAVADLGLNVLSVEHHRAGLDLPVDKVQVLLTLETRDPEHRDQVAAALADRGFPAELLDR